MEVLCSKLTSFMDAPPEDRDMRNPPKFKRGVPVLSIKCIGLLSDVVIDDEESWVFQAQQPIGQLKITNFDTHNDHPIHIDDDDEFPLPVPTTTFIPKYVSYAPGDNQKSWIWSSRPTTPGTRHPLWDVVVPPQPPTIPNKRKRQLSD